MKKIICIISVSVVLTAIVFTSCSKKSNTNVNNNNSNTNQNGPISLVLNSNGKPVGTLFSGTLLAFWLGVSQGVNTTATGEAQFFASIDLSLNNSSAQIYTVTSVYFNDTLFTSMGSYYESFNGITGVTSGKWIVSGGTSIPSFTYTDVNPLPTMHTYTVTTASKSSALVIPFTTLANNYDYAQVLIGGTSLSNGTYITKTYQTKVGVDLTIPSSDLSQFATGSICIVFTLQKYNGQTINGKNFLFVKQVQLPNDSPGDSYIISLTQ